jgi:hypothetical protein
VVAGLVLAGVAAMSAAPAVAAPSNPTPGPSGRAPLPSGQAPSAPPPCGPLFTTAPIPVPAGSVPAGAVLRAMASRIVAVPADKQTGRYTVLVKRMAAEDSTIGDCVETVTDTGTDTMWRDENANSGATYGVAMHRATEPAPPAQFSRYGPGQLRGVIPGRAPADPARLAALLDARYPGEPARRVQGVGELAAFHDTPLRVRRAILLVLAQVHGLRLHQPVTVDGRTGIAVTVEITQNRFVLVINPASGEIIATERVLLDPVIGRNLGVTVPYSESLTVITGRGRTAVAGILPATGRPVIETPV